MATNISQRFSKTGDFYLLVDTDLRGGFRIVASIEERDAIPIQARKQGMIVRVIDSVAGTITNWELGYGKPITNLGWIESSLGGKGDYIPTTGGDLNGVLKVTELGSINFNESLLAEVLDGNLQFSTVTAQSEDDPEPTGLMTFNDGARNTVEINPRIGQIVCAMEVGISSDRRLKTKITRLENSLAITKRMYGYRYELLAALGEVHVGLMAQEVLQVLPEAITRSSDGKLAVRYGNMIALLIENIHEILAVLETKEQRIETIEAILKAHGLALPSDAA